MDTVMSNLLVTLRGNGSNVPKRMTAAQLLGHPPN